MTDTDIGRTAEGTLARIGGRPSTHRRRAALTVILASVVACAWADPAQAQRLGRRFRQAPPAPRAPAARPAPAAAAPGTAPGRSPTPAAGQRSGAAAEKPQTTAAPARSPSPAGPSAPEAPAAIASADVAWDGVVPFGEEWRRRHPAAWKADAERGTGEILLTAGTEGPTHVERTVVPPAAALPRSVLAPSANEADLLVFPSEPTRRS